jgi:hypothetical protein
LNRSPLRKLELPLGYRLLAFLIMVLPPCIFALWVGTNLVHRANQHLDRAAPIVSAELTRAMKRPVSVGKLRFSGETLLRVIRTGTLPPQGLALDIADIRVGTLPSEARIHAGKSILSVPSASVNLTRLKPVAMTVKLKQPSLILTRRPDGQFIIAELLKSKPVKVDDTSKPLDVRIELDDAAVDLLDYSLAGHKVNPRVTALVHVNGVIDAGGLLATRGRFSGEARADNLNGAAVGREIGVGLVVDHPVIGRGQTTRVHITGRDADIDYWMPLAALPKNSIRIAGGRGTADINIVATETKVILSGDVRVAGTSIRLPETKIPEATNIDASINIQDKAVAFSGRAGLSGIPVQMNGFVDLNGETSGGLIVTAERCTTRKVASVLQIPTTAVRGVDLGDATLKRALIEWKAGRLL